MKLIDFGLSEIAAPGETLDTICGTPLYCSPEVLFLHSTPRRKGFFAGPADVWSVGVLIFALLTGCAPFDDSNFTRLREEIYRNAIAYPSHMSDQVKGLLKALLVFDAQLRPTVKDILAYGWFNHATAMASAPESPETADAPSSKCEPAWRNSASASPRKDSRRRSLSCLSESATDGTASTSGSFDDPAVASTTHKQQQQKQQQQQHLRAAATEATATHLSCLEIA